MRRVAKYVLVSLGTLVLLAVLCDRGTQILGVGSADVTIEFVVTNAETGRPVNGARIDWRGELDRRDRNKTEFSMETDADGVARVVAHDVTSTTRESGLGWTVHYTIASRDATVMVMAPGYHPSEPIALYEQPYRTAAVRVAPRQWKLVVPVRLAKEVSGEPRP